MMHSRTYRFNHIIPYFQGLVNRNRTNWCNFFQKTIAFRFNVCYTIDDHTKEVFL